MARASGSASYLLYSLYLCSEWVPFKGLLKGMETLSRPVLVLSIATSLSDQEDLAGEATNSGSLVNPELHSDEPFLQSALDACDEASQNLECDWLDKLHKELESQGISLPERIRDEYLRRFYTSAKGDFVVFI
ncbi:uncharacterized protein LOC120160004 [Hibiscus syriacus]|uniref:uncharacterized protein LOC120160004 n=1 Tax=Hibiscus syriacus TaxID=106335 RepID=UPI0019243EAC|nr:uncharacterized protein LOC120160004 [Hibiscus syriacus]